jgi:hypothetical protein
MKMRYFNTFFLIGSVGLLGMTSCCFKLSKHSLPQYPTSYIFNTTIDSLKLSIKETLNKRQYRGMYLCENSESNCIGVSKGILGLPENKNDFYLYSFDYIGRSSKYYNWWGKLKLDASFHLNIDSLSTRKCQITVNIIDPLVVTGYKIKMGDNKTLIRPCTQIAESSTIEEYQILFLIGEYFKVKDMPYVKLPKR